MKINVTFEEYLKKPLSIDDIKIMAFRYKIATHFIFIFTLSSSFLLGILSYLYIPEHIEMTFMTIIISLIPMLFLSLILTYYIAKLTKKDYEVIIDENPLKLIGGECMKYTKESIVDLKSQFKSPKAIELIKAIEHTDRRPVKAELAMLNILERQFKEELYNKA